jgi:hypothetical protein
VGDSVFRAAHFHIAGLAQRITKRISRCISKLFDICRPFRTVRRTSVMQAHDMPHGLATKPIASLCNYLRSERKDGLRWHTCGRDSQEVAGLNHRPKSVIQERQNRRACVVRDRRERRWPGTESRCPAENFAVRVQSAGVSPMQSSPYHTKIW